MTKVFIDRFMAKEKDIKAQLAESHIDSYESLVRIVISAIADEEGYGDPDPERIHVIDDGDHRGTLVFVIASKGYQPSYYWYVKVSYGSCSGCDSLQAICDYSDGRPTPRQVSEYWQLALNIVQGLKGMQE